jgi:hypothetical protein
MNWSLANTEKGGGEPTETKLKNLVSVILPNSSNEFDHV